MKTRNRTCRRNVEILEDRCLLSTFAAIHQADRERVPHRGHTAVRPATVTA